MKSPVERPGFLFVAIVGPDVVLIESEPGF
jgi:hypothetical protein